MKADGSGLKRLTRAGRGRYDQDPSWSPDGRKILVSSNRHAPERGEAEGYPKYDLYLMNADGSHLRRLTITRLTGFSPWSAFSIWSPDGRAFAYQRQFSAAVLGLDRTGGRTLCASTVESEVVYTPLVWLH